MTFKEFLPDLSLAFILWTIFGVIFAFTFWLITYVPPKILPKPLDVIRFEHMLMLFTLVISLFFIKRFFSISLVNLGASMGLSRFMILIIGGVLIAGIVWFGRRYIERFTEKVLSKVNFYITPLVWLFALLFVLAIPFSLFNTESIEAKAAPEDISYADSLGKKRPNIIFVVMDALTARDMQLYGYKRPTTPFISEWAKDAVVFNRAYSSASWTSPSVMSLMTGKRPWTHRFISYQAFYKKGTKIKYNLPNILKDNGYAVYGFVQNAVAHPERLGISDAFLVKDNTPAFLIPSGWWFDKLMNQVNRGVSKDLIDDFMDIIRKFRPDTYETNAPSEKVYNRFLKYISEVNFQDKLRRPFFAYLHVWPPHDYYLPPEPYAGKFGDAENFNSEKKQEAAPNTKYEPERQKDVDILRKRYDEFVLYSDQRFKSFISRLSEIIDMSNTIIILSSDHGESFSHGFRGHGGPDLYEPMVHIPLIIKMADKIHGRTIDIPVEHTDITATILELAGIPIPEWMEGRSLLPLLEGKGIESLPIFSMQLIGSRTIGAHPITKGTIAVWDGDYKLIHYLEDKKSLLFNVRTDTDETQNIYIEQPEIAQRLKGLIDYNLSIANKKITQSDILSKK